MTTTTVRRKVVQPGDVIRDPDGVTHIPQEFLNEFVPACALSTALLRHGTLLFGVYADTKEEVTCIQCLAQQVSSRGATTQ